MSRDYHSPLREQRAARTRREILDAARRLFAAQGYQATTISQIAEAASVSPQTIYNSIGNKGAVLLALNDVVDEEAQVQPLQARIADTDDPVEVLALTARLRRQLMETAGDIVDVLTSAAHADEEVAEVYREGQERSRNGCRRIVERLDMLGALREGLPVTQAADALYALLHHAVWTRLVGECGWTPDAFETWCTDVLCRALLQADSDPG